MDQDQSADPAASQAASAAALGPGDRGGDLVQQASAPPSSDHPSLREDTAWQLAVLDYAEDQATTSLPPPTREALLTAFAREVGVTRGNYSSVGGLSRAATAWIRTWLGNAVGLPTSPWDPLSPEEEAALLEVRGSAMGPLNAR